MKKPAKKTAQALHRLKALRVKREKKLTTKGTKGTKKKAKITKAADPITDETKLAHQKVMGSNIRPAIEAHELSNRFPQMSPEEYQGLKAAIFSHMGLIHPIVIFEKKVLDGRHRQRACIELGIEPTFQEFDGTYEQAVDYVINASAHRNTTVSQRAWCAALFANDISESRPLGRPSKKVATDATISGKSREVAALRFSVSPRLVQDACKIQEADAELFALLGNGGLNVHQANNRLKLKNREGEVRNLRPLHFSADAANIIEGDCIKRMQEQPAGSIRAIFADPPYNNGWKYNADPTGDNRTDEQFITFCEEWIIAAARVLADDGSIFVLIDDRYSDFIGISLRNAGLHKQRTIVWWETFGNHVKDGLTPCARFIHYYTKSPTFIFNTDVREESARQQLDDKRANPDGKIPTTVWKVSRKQGTANDRVPFADAPPQLPVEIPARCILLASNPGDTILDPFNGNGTTGIAALANGRKYIGIDQSEKYARQSRQWIASQLKPQEKDAA